MLFGKPVRKERIANWAWEGYVNDAASARVSDFCASDVEFPASEAVRMNRYAGPCGNLVFELLHVIHQRGLQRFPFSMIECGGSIQRPLFAYTHPKRVRTDVER